MHACPPNSDALEANGNSAGANETAKEVPAEAAATAAAAAAAVAAADVRVNPPRQTHYRTHVGIGTTGWGEMHAQLEGLFGYLLPSKWLVEYRKRWQRLYAGGWQPLTSLSLAPSGWSAALKFSRNLLQTDNQKVPRAPDGIGLDLHVETKFTRPWASIAQLPNEAELAGLVANDFTSTAGTWQQKVELMIGPEAQLKLMNVTLPLGILIGATFGQKQTDHASSSDVTAPGASSTANKPYDIYVRFETPGLNDLRGYTLEGEVHDSWAGRVKALARNSWVNSFREWSLEHSRKHEAITLPFAVREVVATASSALPSLDRLIGWRPKEPPAVVPSTLVQLGSNGGVAALGLQSGQAGLGGPAWGSSIQMSRAGWAAHLSLAGGGGPKSGRPQYLITAKKAWSAPAEYAHELKWMLNDGQGVWATVRTTETGPRLNFGLEVR